ncbi:MAG: helix-hairpin-helix domain-containing protein [Desulfuromonadaceae bacterium]|nr:helix-hairpin-helix domain-containing protein [Desulfuromonadaceae bacterium]
MKSRSSGTKPTPSAFYVLSSSRIFVKVSGDVVNSGAYDTTANSLASIVINMAGPLCDEKRRDRSLFVDPPVQNGTAVVITRKPDGKCLVTVGSMTVTERLILGIPLNISGMSESDFGQLPGVGPVLAKRISQYRQLNGGILSVKDLAAVEGIGEKKFILLSNMFIYP